MRDLWHQREAKSGEIVKAGGAEILPLEDRQAWADKMQPVYAQFANTPELQSLVQKVQATQ